MSEGLPARRKRPGRIAFFLGWTWPILLLGANWLLDQVTGDVSDVAWEWIKARPFLAQAIDLGKPYIWHVVAAFLSGWLAWKFTSFFAGKRADAAQLEFDAALADHRAQAAEDMVRLKAEFAAADADRVAHTFVLEQVNLYPSRICLLVKNNGEPSADHIVQVQRIEAVDTGAVEPVHYPFPLKSVGASTDNRPLRFRLGGGGDKKEVMLCELRNYTLTDSFDPKNPFVDQQQTAIQLPSENGRGAVLFSEFEYRVTLRLSSLRTRLYAVSMKRTGGTIEATLLEPRDGWVE